MLELTDVISDAEKREALDLALSSKALSRSSQLRSLLRYICEAEIEGRADDLKEYALGVSALGRGPDYSPSADSCVRTRAYELRNKLRVYYELEARDSRIRIEIRKGGYVPQFVRVGENVAIPAPELSATPQAADALAPENTVFRKVLLPVAVGIGAVLLLLLAYVTLSRKMEPEAADADLAIFWAPFLDARIPLIVSYDTRLFLLAEPPGLMVRDPGANQMSEVGSSTLLRRMRERMGLPAFSEVRDYTDTGSLHAVFLLTQMFSARQRPIELKPAGELGSDDIWNNNVILIGRPNLHRGMKYELEEGDFVEAGDRIRNLRPQPGEAAEYRMDGTHGAGEKYAVITRKPGPQPGHSILILAGAGSEYGWALAEYVTNPAHVRESLSHLRSSPGGKLPAAYQMLIRATFDSNVPIRIQYVTHHILDDGGHPR